jgi:SAM-dependent methyltransferase
MPFEQILSEVERYYSQKVIAHGITARGVDWNSPESQQLRFVQLLKVCGSCGAEPGAGPTNSFSINDYGCGFGALVKFLTQRGDRFTYCGFDISQEMIARAKQLYEDQPDVRFTVQESELTAADFTVASGIFNVRMQTTDQEWQQYILATLEKMNGLSKRGFSFNVLTRYSDPEYMRPDLYYADPCFLFDYCKQHFSRNVALLHDYELYEFTILVRK